MAGNAVLDSLQWEGNSQKMVEVVLREIPKLFRGSVVKKIENWALKNNIKVVTEDLVFEAVDEIAPKELAQKRIYPGLEALRSK